MTLFLLTVMALIVCWQPVFSLGRAFSHRERKCVEKKAREGGMAEWGRRRGESFSLPRPS